MENKKITKNEDISDKPAKLKGKYFTVLGKRKTAVARIRIYKKGTGLITVNGEKLNTYFASADITVVKNPLKLTGQLKELDFSVNVRGGGKKGQAEAIRNGLAKGMVLIDEKYKESLRAKGWITRDARKKERKKPGLKKARRAPQWSKR